MKDWLRKKIKKKLRNYKVNVNSVDASLPMQISSGKKVAVVGGGIAGISAAANLAERGFQVTLFEKNKYLGGKLGAWTFESHGETLATEHGFHAFFRQYYNLRNFMQKIDVSKYLTPVDDYLILYKNGDAQGFAGIDNTPGLNVLDLRKEGVFGYSIFLNPFAMSLLHLLKFHPQKTFEQFDGISFQQFADNMRMPSHMRLVFTGFTRAFFAEPRKMSMAELIKGFHYYFLSNDGGLLYDMLSVDFNKGFLQPAAEFIRKAGGNIRLNSAIGSIGYTEGRFQIEAEAFDYCVLAADAKHVKQLISNSDGFEPFNAFRNAISGLKCTDRYAVYRIWTDAFEQKSYPCFVFTDRLKCLDSITFYHKLEEDSMAWSKKNNGGIFELHCYSLPDDFREDASIKRQLLDELFHYFPELSAMKIVHQHFQHRDDFPAFHMHQYKNRPAVETDIPNLFLAGDWVKLPIPAMLMEAAYTSGAMAANCILRSEGLQEHPLESVHAYGLLAKETT
jgi:isorenieratene synthase